MGKHRGEPLEVIDTWSTDTGTAPEAGIQEVGPRRWRRRRRWWWLILVAAGAVAAWAIGFPVRVELASSQIRSLSRAWSTAAAIDVERDTLSNRIMTMAEGSEPPSVIDRALAGLAQQDANLLIGLRGKLAGRWSFAGDVRDLHAAMALALGAEAADLRAAAAGWLSGVALPERSDATDTKVARADNLLTRLLDTHSVGRVQVTDPPRLTAGDGLLATLARVSDRPLPLGLATARGAELWTYDLRSGAAIRRSGLLPFAPAAWIPEPGAAVAFDGNYQAAIVPDGQVISVAHAVAGALAVVVATTPGRFWIARQDGSVVELDLSGAVVAAPVHLPGGASLAAQVPAGLVLSGPHGIDVLDPVTGRTVMVVTADSDAEVLDVAGATVAWTKVFAPPPALWLTSTATGRTVTAATPLARDANDFGPDAGLSPAGDRYASVFVPPGRPAGGQIGVVDASTGAYRPLTASIAAPGAPPAFTWSPDGRWLVALNSDGGGIAVDVPTGAVTPIRLDPTTRILAVATSP